MTGLQMVGLVFHIFALAFVGGVTLWMVITNLYSGYSSWKEPIITALLMVVLVVNLMFIMGK
jgi:hypothetical protein